MVPVSKAVTFHVLVNENTHELTHFLVELQQNPTITV